MKDSNKALYEEDSKQEEELPRGHSRPFEYIRRMVIASEETLEEEIDSFIREHDNYKEELLQIDHPEQIIKSKEDAERYLTIWNRKTNIPYPFKRMLRKWSNIKSQVSFVLYTFQLPEDITQIVRGDTTPIIDRGMEVYDYDSEIKEMTESNYNCEELYQLLMEIDTSDGLQILAPAVSKMPEIVCLGLIWSVSKYDKIFTDIFSCCISSSERSKIVLKKMFEKKPRTTLIMMEKQYAISVSLEDCLDACLECRMLPYIIRELDPLEFSLDLVLLAMSKEIIDLSIILCQLSNEEFINCFLQHMMLRYGKGCSKGIKIYPLTVDIIIGTCMSLEGISKGISKTTQNNLAKLKSLLTPEVRGCLVKRVTLKQQASEFLYNVISGRTTSADAIVYITQVSTNKNAYDTELFECILNEMEQKYALLDRLSQHEIISMALFYGRIIKYELLPLVRIKRTLGTLAQFLRDETKPNRRRFALKALETFCEILEKYPFYAQEFSRTPYVYASNKALYTFIRGHLAIQGISSSEETEEGTRSFSDLISAFLGVCDIGAPWTKSLSTMTVQSIPLVLQEMRTNEVPSEENLAKYLVSKRLLKEPTQIKAYIEFIFMYSDTLYLQVREVLYQILHMYMKEHKCLERAEKAPASRILGTCLGMLTFPERIPIPRKSFDVKEYLVESINKGCIYSVVLFVCKYIEESAHSRIFSNNSPYIKGILKVLAEIHFLTDDSDLISLEIEICFSRLGLQIEDILPDIAIQERRLGAKKKASGIAKYVELEGIRNILAHIIIMALDFAVKEISHSISDRVFQIATRAALEIVKKDFHGHKQAAIEVFKNLSYSLSKQLCCASTATPIYSTTLNNISQFAKIAGMEGSLSSGKINALVEKNMSVCMDVVEYIMHKKMEAGLPSVIEDLVEELEELENKPKAPLPPIQNISLYKEILYTKPDTILVDEIFPMTIGDYHEVCAYLSSINYKSRENGESIGPFTGSPAQKKWDEIQRVLTEIEKMGEAEVKVKLIIELREAFQVAFEFVNSGTNEMSCMFFCQHIIGSIFILTNAWARKECLKAVYKICRASYTATKEMSVWLIYAEDERKFNPEIMALMLEKKILNCTDYDIYLGNGLVKNPQRIKFAVDLLERYVLADVPIGSAFDFIYTIEAISKCTKKSTDERIKNLLREIARRIVLTVNDCPDKQLFNSYTETLFYKVDSKEKTHQLESIFKKIEEKSKDPEELKDFLKLSYSAATEYYLKLRKEHSPIKYMKIEGLAILISTLAKKDISLLPVCLEVITNKFLDGIDICFYAMQVIFTRFLQVLLEELAIDHEDIIFEYLRAIRPIENGVFFAGFVEVLFSEYIIRNMFLRNPQRGLSLLEWVYESLKEIEPSYELDLAVYACAAFALQLKKHCTNFYLNYSVVALTMVPISLHTVLLRNVWSLDRHSHYLDTLLENKERIKNKEYYLLLKKVQECIQSKDLDLNGIQGQEELLSHALADSLSSQKEGSKIFQEIILRIFSTPNRSVLKEYLLVRLLEKTCAISPRPVYIKATLKIILENQNYTTCLEEILKKDKPFINKLLLHVSTILAAKPSIET
ncbi:CCR4-NOT transcription complex subunit 1 [Nematocida sp. AWRm80]|nr:CCR4-NOT transcription complex subunit 1 [Nematocida sp. AWRm80]